MEGFPDHVQTLFKAFLKQNNISQFTIEPTKAVSGDGDGYMGMFEGLRLEDYEGHVTWNLVIKAASVSEKLRRQFPVRAMFLKEMSAYNDVFPGVVHYEGWGVPFFLNNQVFGAEFRSFQEKHNIAPALPFVPECYGTNSEEFKEVLILNNLKEDGFKLHKRTEVMDPHHLKLGLATYAKFHAISMAMSQLEPDRYERIIANIKRPIRDDLTWDEGQPNEADKHPLTIGTLEAVKDNDALVEVVKKFFAKLISLVKGDDMGNDEKGKVMIHGDCWSANMLFKYNEANEPVDIKVIDWQLSCVSNLIYDVSYFFLINAAKCELDDYMTYLKVYHFNLMESLSGYGLDGAALYPFQLFLEQFKKYGSTGFIMCLVMLPQTLNETKTHDLELLAENGQAIYSRSEQVSDVFKSRMRHIVEFVQENEFV